MRLKTLLLLVAVTAILPLFNDCSGGTGGTGNITDPSTPSPLPSGDPPPVPSPIPAAGMELDAQNWAAKMVKTGTDLTYFRFVPRPNSDATSWEMNFTTTDQNSSVNNYGLMYSGKMADDYSLSSYSEVRSVAAGPLTITEYVCGEGALCGSFYYSIPPTVCKSASGNDGSSSTVLWLTLMEGQNWTASCADYLSGLLATDNGYKFPFQSVLGSLKDKFSSSGLNNISITKGMQSYRRKAGATVEDILWNITAECGSDDPSCSGQVNGHVSLTFDPSDSASLLYCTNYAGTLSPNTI